MKKQTFGRKFKRDKNERKALFTGLISAMILNGSIKTTHEKAKAIRPDLEKLVTKAKKGESSKKLLQPLLKPFEIEKMINEIGPTFKDRNGGYTRIIKMGRRFNDDASQALLQWTDEIIKVEKSVIKADSKTKKALKSSAAKSKTASKAKPTKEKPAKPTAAKAGKKENPSRVKK